MPTSKTVRRNSGSAEITLRGLVTARWVLLGLLAGAGAINAFAPSVIDPLLSWFPRGPGPQSFVAVLLVWASINFATMRWLVEAGRATQTHAGSHLLVDALALTVLLAMSGGATNPFTTLYFVPITLATLVSPRWTWVLAGFTLACFAALFIAHPIPKGPPGHEAHFAGHLRGMWVAFGVSGALITYFVHRIALSVARQRDELARLREEAIQDRHLAGLGSLAAGAAHELGTPLGTINLLVGELPHMSADERGEAIDSIKHEVARCKSIVQRMASPDARVSALASDGRSWRWGSLLDELTTPGDVALDAAADEDADSVVSDQAREGLAQILRELVANGAEACRRRAGSTGVTVRLGVVGQDGRIVVSDDGEGMDARTAAAAFDPFFSTKPEGEGMGLGLYLARAQLRQIGGTIDLDSAPDEGSTLTIRIPLKSKEAAYDR